jgi:hypothetical protein
MPLRKKLERIQGSCMDLLTRNSTQLDLYRTHSAYIASKHIATAKDATAGTLQPLHLARILNPHLDALAFPLTSNMTTPISAFLTLRQDTWLRGSVLDAYISVLNEANARSGYKQILVWPSECVKSKIYGNNTIDSKTTFSIEASNIKDLTLTEIADTFAWQCFPLSDDTHWILCLYSTTAKTLTAFDSMNGRQRALSAPLRKALTNALSVGITFLHNKAPEQQGSTMCDVCVARTADYLVAAAIAGGDLQNVQYDTCLKVDAQYRLNMLYWILVYQNSRSKIWSSQGGSQCPITLEIFGDGAMAVGPDDSAETMAGAPDDSSATMTGAPDDSSEAMAGALDDSSETMAGAPDECSNSVHPTCPVCLKELHFLSFNTDFRIPFQGHQKAALAKHVTTEHPDKPVWNALAKQDIEYEGKRGKRGKLDPCKCLYIVLWHMRVEWPGFLTPMRGSMIGIV